MTTYKTIEADLIDIIKSHIQDANLISWKPPEKNKNPTSGTIDPPSQGEIYCSTIPAMSYHYIFQGTSLEEKGRIQECLLLHYNLYISLDDDYSALFWDVQVIMSGANEFSIIYNDLTLEDNQCH